jgi:hypothetical protein
MADRIYVCPVKGVGLSRMPTIQVQTKSEITNVPLLWTELNDVAFTQYHLFHTQVRILERK